MTITAEECDAILAADLAPRERKLNEAIKVPVADHEFDALLSIFFNAGPDFLHSHAIQTLNADDRVGCARHIMDWVHPPEVTGRRHTEQSQFLTPYTIGTHPAPSPHPTAPVAPQQAQWPERPLFADIWKHPYFRRDDDPDHA
jgi:lysozyme